MVDKVRTVERRVVSSVQQLSSAAQCFRPSSAQHPVAAFIQLLSCRLALHQGPITVTLKKAKGRRFAATVLALVWHCSKRH